ncbi:MAG: hypothetical protein JWQ02_2412 [Capsulimonas sp.]|nr:hypothetical protein [Capsulimonas sp.]
MANNFDIEPRFLSGATGLRLQVNPDDFVDGTSWEDLESGGTGQINVALARAYDRALGVGGGDIVEIWARNEDGTETLRARGIVTIPEPTLDLKEQHKLVAYGFMEDMNHVLLDKVLLIPGGADLNYFAGRIADDYAARRPGLRFVRDIQATGISLERLALDKASARDAMDKLQEQAGRNIVWGWDIDPPTGLNRFYLRPRVTTVGHQFFAGKNVRVISSPLDYTNIVNAIQLKGGPAKYPQLITNPSFELPTLPSENNGNLLDDGSFERGIAWTFVGGAARHYAGDGASYYNSAHTDKWFVALTAASQEAWQECAVTPATKQYQASLFVAAENGADLPSGRLIVEGRASGGTVLETYTLPLAPPGVAWGGGQGTTILSSDALTLSMTFQNASITKARVRIVADVAHIPGGNGMLVDDVIFCESTAVGQYGWEIQYNNPSNTADKFVAIDWACPAAAREGYYGVRATVTTDSSSVSSTGLNDKPQICPYPGQDRGKQGYHFKPTPFQQLRCVAYVRMSPGLNTAAGSAFVEYHEWDGSGNGTQYQNAVFTIPNNGTWVKLYKDVTAHNNAASAMTTVSFAVGGTYDVDYISCRDAAADSDDFLRGSDFERYITAEEVCTALSAQALSAATYGRREAVISNSDIIDWNANGKAWAKAQFDRGALPMKRDRVDLTHEHDQTPRPGEGTLIRISGLASADIQDWAARVQYTWARQALTVSLELSNERPSIAKLLKAREASASSSGGGSASAVAAVGAGPTTPSTPPLASPTASGTVKTTASHADPVVYEKTEADALLAALAATIPTIPKRRWQVQFREAAAAASTPDTTQIIYAPAGPANTSITWIPKIARFYVPSPTASATTVDLVYGASGNAAFGAGTTLLTAAISLSGATNYQGANVTSFASGASVVSGARLAPIWSAIGGAQAIVEIEFEEQ